MVSIRRWLVRTERFRNWIVGGIIAFIIAEILFFSPSSVDSLGPNAPSFELDPQELAASFESDLKSLGMDTGKIPEYTVNDFDYISIQKGHLQWKLKAEKGLLYHQNRLVLAKQAQAELHDVDGKITYVTGKYARYFMNQRDLEVYGSVTTQFADGFVVHSDYVKYDPEQRKIDVPSKYSTQGEGLVESTRRMHFTSQGLRFRMADNNISLPQDVVFTIEPTRKSASNQTEVTTIESDQCLINRSSQKSTFTMNPSRVDEEAFVHLRQPSLLIKSRRMELSYGNDGEQRKFDSILAEQDVFLQEKNEKKVKRYATAGQAVFDSKKNTIVLKEFPQLYQDEDTVTGEVIVLHRDTDVVEVEKSNAFNRGETSN